MPHTPVADTRSPWYEAFAPAAEAPETRWLPKTQFRAPAEVEAEAASAVNGGAEEQWATEALFDYYNG
jgi:hypothetical protein